MDYDGGGRMDYEGLVRAIRASNDLGHGSCSWVDECLTDDELADVLRKLVNGAPRIQPMMNPTEKKLLHELRDINRAVTNRLMERT